MHWSHRYRSYQRQLLSFNRSLNQRIAGYQTPELFQEPVGSKVSRQRSVGFFPRIQTVWTEPHTFEASQHIRKGVHSIWYEGLPIDMELTRSHSKVLIVVFHGALGCDAVLPVFPGANVTRGLGVARLSFSDPTLYLSPKLPLAWYAGNQFQTDLQSVITRIIRKVAVSIGAKRIVLFGSSGGGFASLIQAAALPEAVVVVANAQTDVLRYHKDHVNRYIEIAWGGDCDTLVESNAHSAIKRLTAESQIPQLLYLQNSTDEFHIRQHLLPLIQAAGEAPNFHLLMGNWGEGHIAPPKGQFREVLEAVVSNDAYSLRSMGFTPASLYKFS